MPTANTISNPKNFISLWIFTTASILEKEVTGENFEDALRCQF